MEVSSTLVNAGLFWILLSVVLICFKRTRMIGIVTLSSIAFCFLVNNVVLKNVVARARPFDTYSDIIPLIAKPTDYSFASGHTTCSFAAAVSLSRFLNRPLAIVSLVFAALVSFSRLYLGVHYPTDVLVGLAIGFFGSFFIYYLYSKKFDLDKYKLRPRADT